MMVLRTRGSGDTGLPRRGSGAISLPHLKIFFQNRFPQKGYPLPAANRFWTGFWERGHKQFSNQTVPPYRGVASAARTLFSIKGGGGVPVPARVCARSRAALRATPGGGLSSSFHLGSFAMRWTVPVPIPSDLATFEIPMPFASCFRTLRSVVLSIFGLPSFTPWATARLRPALILLANHGPLKFRKGAGTWKTSLPIGVVVSMACWSRYRSTPHASRCWIVSSKSISERPKRSIAHAMTISNFRRLASLSIASSPAVFRPLAPEIPASL